MIRFPSPAFFACALAGLPFLALIAAAPARAQCEGQGNATLTLNGRCDVGSPLRLRLVGEPNARYVLARDSGAGPTHLPGKGTVCLDLSPDLEVVATGRLDAKGRGLVLTQIPNDVALVGTTLSFQFGFRHPDAPNGVAISNAYVFDVCPAGSNGDACSGKEAAGIERIDFIFPVKTHESLPADVLLSVFDPAAPVPTIGSLSLAFDPDAPPAFPIVSANGGLEITKITSHTGVVLIHASVSAAALPSLVLPGVTRFEARVGSKTVSRDIDVSCEGDIGPGFKFKPMYITSVGVARSSVLLVIDEDSIDNDMDPNRFSAGDVNDDIADIGLREILPYFANNVGATITLVTGQVGDEGWFALKTIPESWAAAGPTSDGACNFLMAGPGLGTPDGNGDRESLLDKIPDVTPLRAAGLKLLEGCTVTAVVFDSDISINYSPLDGSLKGANYGIVTFKVIEVVKRTDGSSSSLPYVTIEILDAGEVCGSPISLFTDAPVPISSSEPMDVCP